MIISRKDKAMKKYTLGELDYFDTEKDAYIIYVSVKRKTLSTDLSIWIRDEMTKKNKSLQVTAIYMNCYLVSVKLITQKDTGKQFYQCTYKPY